MDLVGQAAFPDAGFAEDVDQAGPLTAENGLGEFEQVFYFFLPTHQFSAVAGLAERLSPADQVESGDRLLNAFVLNIPLELKAEGGRPRQFIVNQNVVPVGGAHDAGRQVDPVTDASVLLTLPPSNKSGEGRTDRKAHPVAKGELLLLAEGVQLSLDRQAKLQRAHRIILVGNRSAEEYDHQRTLVAVVDLFEVAAEIMDLIEDHGSKLIELLVVPHLVEGKEGGDYRAELSALVVPYDFGGKKGSGDLRVHLGQVQLRIMGFREVVR